MLDLGLLGDLQIVIYLDAEVSHGAFEFGVTEEMMGNYPPRLLQLLAIRCRCFFTTTCAGDLTIDVLNDPTAGLRRASYVTEWVANASSLATHSLA